MPTYSAYVAFFKGGDGIVVLSPGGDSNAPRNIALAVLAHLQGKPVPEPSPRVAPTLDLVAAALLLFNWLFTAWVLARTKDWVHLRRPVWRTVLGLAPYALTVGAVLVGLPSLVGQAIPWSWIWLGYYYPIWALFLLSLASTSLLIIAIRSVALLRYRKSTNSAAFMPGPTSYGIGSITQAVAPIGTRGARRRSGRNGSRRSTEESYRRRDRGAPH